ncbi:MAG TPA: hypothetical protein VFA78_00715 [Chloroflexota bacterium]|nr:hypothetical protein [Chloroflexota bacterium]
MRRLAAGLSCLVLLLWLPGAAHATSNEGVSLGPTEITAEPLDGHAGDPIYLSGTGFPKNTNLEITMVCPRILTPGYVNNTEIWYPGPRTNSQGSFVGYKINAIKLTGMKSSPCTIYSSNGANPLGVDIPESYRIFARTQQLPSSATRMTAAVRTSPAQAHGGQMETVSLSQGWPGAYTTVYLKYGGLTLSKSLRLNASGAGRVRWQLGHVRGAVSARVSVRMRLGRYKGNGAQRFTVTG